MDSCGWFRSEIFVDSLRSKAHAGRNQGVQPAVCSGVCLRAVGGVRLQDDGDDESLRGMREIYTTALQWYGMHVEMLG
jgi:hypothetical protein